MKTVADRIDQYLDEAPFLEDALNEGLINMSSLARKFKSRIEQETREHVSEAGILMGLRRRKPKLGMGLEKKLKDYTRKLGDITVRTDLEDFTYKNSQSFFRLQSDLVQAIAQRTDSFYTFSRGVEETTIITNQYWEKTLLKLFENEKLLQRTPGLASFTVKLPQTNFSTLGLYYFMFKHLAQRGVNICEVISTTNEFTLVVDKSDVEKTFEAFTFLKQ